MNKLATSKRLIVKIGSALLIEDDTGKLRRRWLEALAEDLAALKEQGVQIAVVSSGAVAIGPRPLGLKTKGAKLEEMQAAAATG